MMINKIFEPNNFNISPALLIGAFDDKGSSKFVKAVWGGVYSMDPFCFAISLKEQDEFYEYIFNRGAFSVNIPSNISIEINKHNGSDNKKCKALKWSITQNNKINAPYITQFPYIINCIVKEAIKDSKYIQIIGEVIDIIVHYNGAEINNNFIKDVAFENNGPIRSIIKTIRFENIR